MKENILKESVALLLSLGMMASTHNKENNIEVKQYHLCLLDTLDSPCFAKNTDKPEVERFKEEATFTRSNSILCNISSGSPAKSSLMPPMVWFHTVVNTTTL